MIDRAFHLLALCAITRISLLVDDLADDAQQEVRMMGKDALEWVNRSAGQHARQHKRQTVGRG